MNNLEELQKTLDEIKKKQTLENEIESSGFTRHIINLILQMQDLNEKFHSLDTRNVQSLIEDFKRYLNTNLQQICKKMIDTNDAIVKCDMSQFSRTLDNVHNRLNIMDKRLNEIEKKKMTIKMFAERGETSICNISEDLSFKLATPLNEIQFCVRTINIFQSLGISTLRDLVQLEEHDIIREKNCGKKSLQEIKQKLLEMDLSLGMVLDEEYLKNK